jgi:hypothetical protein
VIFGTAGSRTPGYSYLCTNLDNDDFEDNTAWGGLNPGYYSFTATDGNGSTLTEHIFLDSIHPIAGFTINYDQLNTDCQGTAPVYVEITNTSENFANPFDPEADTTFLINLNYDYSPWTISHDIFETFDTTYLSRGQTFPIDICLVAINKNGCSDTMRKLVTIYQPIKFEPINIFTPNGDAINAGFTFEFKSASIS